jgi:hypothetical protein
LDWIGQYIVDHAPRPKQGKPGIDVIIDLGDHYDLPSLSSYDKGRASFEGRRFRRDVDAGHRALERLEAPLNKYNRERRERKEKQWEPEKHVTWGNHEDRANRAAENNPELEGFVGTHIFDEFWQDRGWTTHQYGEVVDIDGIWYSHLFLNEFTGQALGAQASTLLKQVGHTFTQGHRQTYDIATRYVGKKMHRALIAGACYLHDEHYKGPARCNSERSGNHHWRGAIHKFDVGDGMYSMLELPLDYFCRRYEGVTLERFMRKVYPVAVA